MKANEVIKVRRKELGLTMKEVADRVGVSEATVSGGRTRTESACIRTYMAVVPNIIPNNKKEPHRIYSRKARL